MGHAGATCYSRLHLEGLNWCYNFTPISRVEKVCRALLTHYLILSSVNKKLFKSSKTPFDFMKSQRKRIPVVFTLHSTRAHVDTFFYGDEIFWSWFWIPKDGECFFLYNVFILVEFPVNKEGLVYWKIHQMFFPMLNERIWMLSRLCCCIAVHTFHMYASSMGISACLKNASVSAFHFFFHTMLNRHFSLLEHCQYHVGIILYSDSFDHLFHERSAGSSSALWHDVLLCLSEPYAASHWSPCSSNQNHLYPKLWASLEVLGLSISIDTLLRKTFLRAFLFSFDVMFLSVIILLSSLVRLRPQCCHFWPLQSLLAMKTDMYSFMGLTMNISDRMYIL